MIRNAEFQRRKIQNKYGAQLINEFRVYNNKMNKIYEQLEVINESSSNNYSNIVKETFYETLNESFFGDVAHKMGNRLRGAKDIAKGAVKGAVNTVAGVKGAVKGAVNTATDAVKGAAKSVADTATSAVDKGKELANSAIDAGKNLINKVTEVSKKVAASIAAAPENILNIVKGAWGDVMTGISNVLEEAKKKGNEAYEAAKLTVKSTVDGFVKPIVDTVKSAQQKIGDSKEAAFKFVADKRDSLKTTAQIMMKSGSDKLKQYGNDLHKVLSVMSPSEEQLNALAANTLVYYKKKNGEIKSAYVNPKQDGISPEVVSVITKVKTNESINEAYGVFKKAIINIGGYKESISTIIYYAALSPIIISIFAYEAGKAVLAPIITSAIGASQYIATAAKKAGSDAVDAAKGAVDAVKDTGTEMKTRFKQGYSNEKHVLSFGNFKKL
jgi:vacuolar-type H+-ATPase subunit H